MMERNVRFGFKYRSARKTLKGSFNRRYRGRESTGFPDKLWVEDGSPSRPKIFSNAVRLGL